MALSSLTITFNYDLPVGARFGFNYGKFLIIYPTLYYFTVASTRNQPFDVAFATPTAIDGEATAINFVTAANIDFNFQKNITQNGNQVTITGVDEISSFFYTIDSGTFFLPPTNYDIVFGNIIYENNSGVSINFTNIPPVTIPYNSLIFSAIKNLQEPVAKTVSVNSAGPFVIEKDNWVNLSYTTTGLITIFTVVPIATNLMALGNYLSDIKIYVNSVLIQIIAVSYSLENYISSPYVSGKIAFTLDTIYFDFNTQENNTYFQVNATIKCYDFFTNAIKEYNLNQKILTFNGKSRVNLGLKIHRLMANFENPNLQYQQYRPAVLKIDFAEKRFAGNLLVRQITLNDIDFIAGLSKNFVDFGFLNFNSKSSRVTKNGFAILNMLPGKEINNLRVYKNNILESSNIITNEVASAVVSVRKTFENYNQGDVIKFTIESLSDVVLSEKSFCVFPDSEFSNMIIWEDEFLLQASMEMTGTFALISELDFITQKAFVNLVEKLKIIDTTKETKLTINTGWLKYSDIDSVESLMRSKRAWLNDIELRPISKKITNQNPKEETIEFNLEFLINRKYNEETYSL